MMRHRGKKVDSGRLIQTTTPDYIHGDAASSSCGEWPKFGCVIFLTMLLP
jgi:hypothetical protein